VRPSGLLGVGTGSTVAHFVAELSASGLPVSRAVSTSASTDRLLISHGISVVALEEAGGPVDVYVDGADEVDALGRAIKGGGGAHTREKRVAEESRTWVCIVDDTKLVTALGALAAVPVEVERDHEELATSTITSWGATVRLREDWSGDPLHVLLDVVGLDLSDPLALELALEALPGVVACGIFARRRADVVLVGRADGVVNTLQPSEKPGA
jgi:ribose 5-phosphate isomerase A